MTDHLDNPVIAAAQASEAVTELLRFHREGPAGHTAFGDVEVCEKLAEALCLAIAIHVGEGGLAPDPEERELLDRLRAACAAYLAGWAG